MVVRGDCQDLGRVGRRCYGFEGGGTEVVIRLLLDSRLLGDSTSWYYWKHSYIPDRRCSGMCQRGRWGQSRGGESTRQF